MSVVFRSPGWWQHPEHPLFPPSGSLTQHQRFHRCFSAGRSGRRAVRLCPVPDHTRYSRRHLRRVVPPLVLCRLAGEQTDVTPAGKTNASKSISLQLFEIPPLSCSTLTSVFHRFWCLQKNALNTRWAPRSLTASWTPSAAFPWSSPSSCCQPQPMRSKLWVCAQRCWSLITL